MLIEKIVGNSRDIDLGQRDIDLVYMEWFELEKKHIKKVSQQGVELGFDLQEPLKNKDIVYMDNEKALVVEQLPCKLTQAQVDSMEEMGRLCFELGNRHLSLAIEGNLVSVVYDKPTFEYLHNKGFSVKEVEGLFDNYIICHAHGHAHTH